MYIITLMIILVTCHSNGHVALSYVIFAAAVCSPLCLFSVRNDMKIGAGSEGIVLVLRVRCMGLFAAPLKQMKQIVLI